MMPLSICEVNIHIVVGEYQCSCGGKLLQKHLITFTDESVIVELEVSSRAVIAICPSVTAEQVAIGNDCCYQSASGVEFANVLQPYEMVVVKLQMVAITMRLKKNGATAFVILNVIRTNIGVIHDNRPP